MGKDETVSRTRKLEHDKKNEEDCALGSHRGWDKRQWIGGGCCSSGSGPGLSICSDR